MYSCLGRRRLAASSSSCSSNSSSINMAAKVLVHCQLHVHVVAQLMLWSIYN